MLSTIAYQNPEAFQSEWEEERKTLAWLAMEQVRKQPAPAACTPQACEEIQKELALFKTVRSELEIEWKKPPEERRYARLARKYAADLRQVFWHGHLKRKAQQLLRELELESTVPMEDLGTKWEQDGEDMVELDSYTMTPLDAAPPENGWHRDYAEVQAYRQLAEVAGDYEIEADPAVMEALIDVAIAGEHALPKTEAPVLFYQPSDNVRFVEELQGLGCTPEMIQQALDSQFDLAGDEEQIAYNDEIDEAQLNGAVEQMALDGYNPAEVAEIKKALKGQPQVLARCKGEVSFPKECRLMGLLKVFEVAYKVSAKWVYRHCADPSEEEILANIWNNRFGFQLHKMLHELGSGFRPASLAVAFLSKEEWEDFASWVPVHGYQSLEEYIEMFGDELLDQAFGVLEDPGWELSEAGWIEMHPSPTDDAMLDDYDPRIEKLSQEWVKEIIAQDYEEDPRDDKGNPVIECSRAYAEGWFAALAKNVSDLKGAGYAAWRWSRSKSGARAYDLVMAEQRAKGVNWKDANRAAMRSFWNAGPITAILCNGSGVKVTSEANGSEQTVNWGLAVWKYKHGEIYLCSEDKARLKALLQERSWGYQMIQAL